MGELAPAAVSNALVIGAGVVGVATAGLLARNGFRVFGDDVRPEALDGFPGERFDRAEAGIPLSLVVVSVPTPVRDGRMSSEELRSGLGRAVKAAEASSTAPLVAIRSTLMPGMLAEFVRAGPGSLSALKRGGLCYWPSFARERQATADELEPPVVVFGTDDMARVHSVLGGWLASLTCTVRFLSFEEAELAKAGANAFNALKISYFNAVSDWAAIFGADGQAVASAVAEAAEGVRNPAYGTGVGPAFGGACLPKDLEALISRLEEAGAPHSALLGAVQEINRSPLRQIEPDAER